MNTKEHKISESTIVIAVPEQISSDIGGETVILNLKSGFYSGLNEVAARIWTLIQEPKSVKAVKEILLEEYQVEAETCDRQLQELLLQLQAAGLIEVRDETTA